MTKTVFEVGTQVRTGSFSALYTIAAIQVADGVERYQIRSKDGLTFWVEGSRLVAA